MGICPVVFATVASVLVLLSLPYVWWMIFLSWVPISSDFGGLLEFVASSRLSVCDNHV